jgi:hypothetical protein
VIGATTLLSSNGETQPRELPAEFLFPFADRGHTESTHQADMVNLIPRVVAMKGIDVEMR